MNAPKCIDTDYIDCLVASPRVVSGTEAARVHPAQANPPAHDAFTRLLHRLEPTPATLWAEGASLVQRDRGILVLDDTTRATPYAHHSDLVTRHWSGQHRQVVHGINLLTLRWPDGERLLPIDYRIYDKAKDGLTKNDHCRAMLLTAQQRGFTPAWVVFDSWYASVDTLKAIRGYGWPWLTQRKSNRLVNPDGTGNQPLSTCAIAEAGTRLHRQGYGFIRVFLIVSPDGDRDYWATDDLGMGALTRLKYAEFAWGIEAYHRGLKQYCGVERCQVRAGRAQRNHMGCAMRAFVRLEGQRCRTGISWWEAKMSIIRDAIRAYLAAPRSTLAPTA